MKIPSRLLVALAVLASLCGAGETKTWSQNDYSDFEKGNLKKLSLSSDGRLRLAPAFREIFDSASVYLWALAEDSKGNLYAGGGGPGGPGARLYLVSPDGKGKTLAQWDDLEVHGLAIDKSDRLYAGTSPDGKVYKIEPGGKPQLFYDPHAKYIWGMAFDSRGNLFIATGAYIVGDFIVTYGVMELKIRYPVASAFMAIMALTSVMGGMTLMTLSDHLGRKSSLLIIHTGLALSILLILLARENLFLLRCAFCRCNE